MLAGLKEKAARLKRETLATWFIMRHPRTPWWLKAFGILIVAYALSTIDLIPDFLPAVGYIDELLLLPAMIWFVIRSTPPEILVACRKRADEWLATGTSEPASTLGAIIVVTIWITLAWWLLSSFATSPS